MRCLILIDAQFASHERALVERLVVGLAHEGVHTQVVLPKGAGFEDSGFDLIQEPIWYADRGISLTRKIRAQQVARQVLSGPNTSKIDIVHVFGGGAWALGRELAKLLDAGVLLELWRSGMLDSVQALRIDEGERVLCSVPEKAFLTQYDQSEMVERVRVAHWGASIQPEPQRTDPDRAKSIVLLGSGRQREQSLAAFEGVVDAIASREDTLLFANYELVDRIDLWKRVEQRKITDRFTIIDRSEDRRDLVLRCDFLVYPDTLHEERTLLLDAMGAGMTILAGNDECIAPIQECAGITVIDKPSRTEWATKLSTLLDHPDHAKSAGIQAKEYASKERRMGNSIIAVIESYTALLGESTQKDPV